MSRLRFDASQMFKNAEDFEAAPDHLNRELQNALNDIGQEGTRLAREVLMENDSWVTGGLGDSIEVLGTRFNKKSLSVTYGPSEPYPARWLEKGRRAVHAPPGRKLKFQIKGKGPYLYRQSVGPAAPKPFMYKSARRLRPYANHRLSQAVSRAISKS